MIHHFQLHLNEPPHCANKLAAPFSYTRAAVTITHTLSMTTHSEPQRKRKQRQQVTNNNLIHSKTFNNCAK